MRIISFLLRLYCSTWKVTRGESYFSDRKDASILASWHGEILPLLWFHRKEKIAPIVSHSKDGDRLCSLLLAWGYRYCIRGSSSKGGRQALLDAQDAVQEGWTVAFALDGPQGPPMEPKAGALLLALKTGKPIILLRTKVSRAYYLSSWDRFCIPWPFAHIELCSSLWFLESRTSGITQAPKEEKKLYYP